MAYPRSGPASRAVALDLMLRTFMNSADFQASNPKIWDNIARLVPGTTPQQCIQRWDELSSVHGNTVAGDYSGLTAQGRPISAQSHSQKRQMSKLVRSLLSSPSGSTSRSSHGNSCLDYPQDSMSRPHSVASNSAVCRDDVRVKSGGGGGGREREVGGERGQRRIQRSKERYQGGKFVANFYQNVLGNKNGDRDECEKKEDTEAAGEEGGRTGGRQEHRRNSTDEVLPADETLSSESQSSATSIGSSLISSPSTPNMVIHVCDEAKKLKRDFVCPRDVLIREMKYFSEYLTSDSHMWDEVDISVHCDVPVFTWLMTYAKRGMMEGPCGEKLREPLSDPSMEASNAVSILISSDFLKMDTLVEECLHFCHRFISSVASSPSNMSCINSKLLARLAALFTPMEVESIIDRKDKIKSKLFAHHLEQLFKPSSSPSAASLYRCKHCGRLMIVEQESLLPCTPERLAVSRTGQVVYRHERSSDWNINQYTQSLQQHGLTIRDIYWRLWGVVNCLVCSRCGSVFQCHALTSCTYHSQSPVNVGGARAQHFCCQQPATHFSVLPRQQIGCSFRDHIPATISSSSSSSVSSTGTLPTNEIHSILLCLREAICWVDHPPQQQQQQPNATITGSSRAGKSADGAQGAQDGNGAANPEVVLLESQATSSSTRWKAREPVPPSASAHVPKSGSQHAASLPRAGSHHSNSTAAGTRPVQSIGMAMRREHLHDLSDMEEDDEIDAPIRLAPVSPAKLKKSRQLQSTGKQKHTRGGDTQSSAPQLHAEWIWDSQKSKRWNQDMLRESDERRLKALETELSRLKPSASGPSSADTGHPSSNTKPAAQTLYAGGIFSRLEAQFQAQQAAKAMPVNAQTRLQGSGRRK